MTVILVDYYDDGIGFSTFFYLAYFLYSFSYSFSIFSIFFYCGFDSIYSESFDWNKLEILDPMDLNIFPIPKLDDFLL